MQSTPTLSGFTERVFNLQYDQIETAFEDSYQDLAERLAQLKTIPLLPQIPDQHPTTQQIYQTYKTRPKLPFSLIATIIVVLWIVLDYFNISPVPFPVPIYYLFSTWVILEISFYFVYRSKLKQLQHFSTPVLHSDQNSFWGRVRIFQNMLTTLSLDRYADTSDTTFFLARWFLDTAPRPNQTALFLNSASSNSSPKSTSLINSSHTSSSKDNIFLPHLPLGNFLRWIAWAMFSRFPNQLSLDEAQECINYVRVFERVCPTLKFERGVQDESIKAMRLSLEPVNTSIHRPLASYYLISCIQSVVKLILHYYMGFQRKQIGPFHYWFRSRADNHSDLSPDIVTQLRNDRTHPPAVFVHGIGHGLLYYCQFVSKLTFSHDVFLVELPFISNKFFEAPSNSDTLVSFIDAMLAEHNYNKALFISHSYGTFVTSFMIKFRPHLVHSIFLLDPVALLLCLPTTCHSFVYAKSVTPMDWIRKIFVSTELTIASVMRRAFFWIDMSLFLQDLPRIKSKINKQLVAITQDKLDWQHHKFEMSRFGPYSKDSLTTQPLFQLPTSSGPSTNHSQNNISIQPILHQQGSVKLNMLPLPGPSHLPISTSTSSVDILSLHLASPEIREADANNELENDPLTTVNSDLASAHSRLHLLQNSEQSDNLALSPTDSAQVDEKEQEDTLDALSTSTKSTSNDSVCEHTTHSEINEHTLEAISPQTILQIRCNQEFAYFPTHTPQSVRRKQYDYCPCFQQAIASYLQNPQQTRAQSNESNSNSNSNSNSTSSTSQSGEAAYTGLIKTPQSTKDVTYLSNEPHQVHGAFSKPTTGKVPNKDSIAYKILGFEPLENEIDIYGCFDVIGQPDETYSNYLTYPLIPSQTKKETGDGAELETSELNPSINPDDLEAVSVTSCTRSTPRSSQSSDYVEVLNEFTTLSSDDDHSAVRITRQRINPVHLGNLQHWKTREDGSLDMSVYKPVPLIEPQDPPSTPKRRDNASKPSNLFDKSANPSHDDVDTLVVESHGAEASTTDKVLLYIPDVSGPVQYPPAPRHNQFEVIQQLLSQQVKLPQYILSAFNSPPTTASTTTAPPTTAPPTIAITCIVPCDSIVHDSHPTDTTLHDISIGDSVHHNDGESVITTTDNKIGLPTHHLTQSASHLTPLTIQTNPPDQRENISSSASSKRPNYISPFSPVPTPTQNHPSSQPSLQTNPISRQPSLHSTNSPNFTNPPLYHHKQPIPHCGLNPPLPYLSTQSSFQSSLLPPSIPQSAAVNNLINVKSASGVGLLSPRTELPCGCIMSCVCGITPQYSHNTSFVYYKSDYINRSNPFFMKYDRLNCKLTLPNGERYTPIVQNAIGSPVGIGPNDNPYHHNHNHIHNHEFSGNFPDHPNSHSNYSLNNSASFNKSPVNPTYFVSNHIPTSFLVESASFQTSNLQHLYSPPAQYYHHPHHHPLQLHTSPHQQRNTSVVFNFPDPTTQQPDHTLKADGVGTNSSSDTADPHQISPSLSQYTPNPASQHPPPSVTQPHSQATSQVKLAVLLGGLDDLVPADRIVRHFRMFYDKYYGAQIAHLKSQHVHQQRQQLLENQQKLRDNQHILDQTRPKEESKKKANPSKSESNTNTNDSKLDMAQLVYNNNVMHEYTFTHYNHYFINHSNNILPSQVHLETSDIHLNNVYPPKPRLEFASQGDLLTSLEHALVLRYDCSKPNPQDANTNDLHSLEQHHQQSQSQSQTVSRTNSEFNSNSNSNPFSPQHPAMNSSKSDDMCEPKQGPIDMDQYYSTSINPLATLRSTIRTRVLYDPAGTHASFLFLNQKTLFDMFTWLGDP